MHPVISPWIPILILTALGSLRFWFCWLAFITYREE